ncbi:hypothetical protein JKP88DRAFT_29908 [Tribonema minus]|uniref:Uncharacterized protein n=1 Tax=Tribonema minus TaxID=303371 RepID=A0A835ZFF2_9STRA|nr:hypothetical protein JKP88DRAFT_29908 [Tribonema minus]
MVNIAVLRLAVLLTFLAVVSGFTPALSCRARLPSTRAQFEDADAFALDPEELAEDDIWSLTASAATAVKVKQRGSGKITTRKVKAFDDSTGTRGSDGRSRKRNKRQRTNKGFRAEVWDEEV